MTESAEAAERMPGLQLAARQRATDAGGHTRRPTRRLLVTRKKDRNGEDRCEDWRAWLLHPRWISFSQSPVLMDLVKPPDMTPSFSLSLPSHRRPIAHNRHKKLYDREAVLDWSLRDKHSKLLPLGNRAQSPLTGLGFDLWKGSRWAGMDTRRDGERRGSLGNRASEPWKGSRRTAAHPCLCRWPITKACLSTA